MRPGIKLFVGNVPEEATAEELSELFAGVAGPVLGVALMKQFAFVHLRDEAAAARAITQLNGHQLHGRRIVVEPSRPRPTNTCKIFVGNVSAACTSGELRSLFQQYGTVVECDVVKDYAFVHMENEADAKVAIENLNGKEVKGRRVNVELSTNVQKKGAAQTIQAGIIVDKNKRIGLEYREKFQPKIDGFDQRRAADSTFPSAAAGYATSSLYDYQQRFGGNSANKYDSFDAQARPASPSYFGRDRSPLRRSPSRATYSTVTLPMTAQPAAYRPSQLGQQAASYLGISQTAAAAVAPPYERTRLSPPRSAGYDDPYKKSTALAKRYNSDRRLSDLSDYRRLADSPLAYRRSPTKSPMDYRRLPEAHSDYARYSGGYGDYMHTARMHSSYQRRL
nr:PREDICTED: RNA-binding protein 14-like [Apteryx mantelli mantelli]